jgi:hypothetical protein
MRPSFVGPVELKLVNVPLEATAPAERMLSASAGASRVPIVPLPLLSFPMEFTTSTPRRVAITAALVVTAVLPSNCPWLKRYPVPSSKIF